MEQLKLLPQGGGSADVGTLGKTGWQHVLTLTCDSYAHSSTSPPADPPRTFMTAHTVACCRHNPDVYLLQSMCSQDGVPSISEGERTTLHRVHGRVSRMTLSLHRTRPHPAVGRALASAGGTQGLGTGSASRLRAL